MAETAPAVDLRSLAMDPVAEALSTSEASDLSSDAGEDESLITSGRRKHRPVLRRVHAMTALLCILVVCWPLLLFTDRSVSWVLVSMVAAASHLGYLYDSSLAELPEVPLAFSSVLSLASCFTIAQTGCRLWILPRNDDDLSDFTFAILALVVFAFQIQWSLYQMRGDSSTMSRLRLQKLGLHGCGHAFFLLLGVSVALSNVVGGIAAVHYLYAHPPVTFVGTPRGYIHYWCRGDVRDGAVIVLQSGMSMPMPAPALFWFQELSNVTRTCTIDPSGTGWSQTQASVGWDDDAADIKAVIDQELSDVAPTQRTAILLGHSGSAVTLYAFKDQFQTSFRRVLAVSLQGSQCHQKPKSLSVARSYTGITTITEMQIRWGIASTLSLWVPVLRLLLPHSLNYFQICADGTTIKSDFERRAYSMDIPVVTEYTEYIIRPSFMRRFTYQVDVWRRGGQISKARCRQAELDSDVLLLHAQDYCIDDHFQPAPRHGAARWCAGHNSLVTVRHFAEQAIAAVRPFLQTRLVS